MGSEFGGTLTALARRAVETGFAPRPPHPADLLDHLAPPPRIAALDARGASFVTLERGSRLRGCIGTLSAVRPLGLDVVRNARLAARDPRLDPVEQDELPELTVTVSVLSQARPLVVHSFAALLDRLRPGTDGLTLLGPGRRRATFLPSVWRSLAEPEQFVAALLRKGGWPSSLWTSDLRLAVWPDGLVAERYTTDSFSARWAG